jgi:hypothetical protein
MDHPHTPQLYFNKNNYLIVILSSSSSMHFFFPRLAAVVGVNSVTAVIGVKIKVSICACFFASLAPGTLGLTSRIKNQ